MAITPLFQPPFGGFEQGHQVRDFPQPIRHVKALKKVTPAPGTFLVPFCSFGFAVMLPLQGKFKKKGRFALMQKIIQVFMRFRIWKDRRGQDLIEYALMAGFVAVAAGAIMP